MTQSKLIHTFFFITFYKNIFTILLHYRKQKILKPLIWDKISRVQDYDQISNIDILVFLITKCLCCVFLSFVST